MVLWRTRVADHNADGDSTAAVTGPDAEPLGESSGRPGPLMELHPPDEPRPWLFPGADELYRSIYTAVSFAPSDVLAVTSAISGEGKTTTAVGLAVTAAQDAPDRKVLLVEADLDRPVMAGDFAVDASPGLVDCLFSDEPVQSAYRTTFLHNLHLMPAGISSGNLGRLLRSPQMPEVLETMKRRYDLVILDGPAVLVNSDAMRLCDLANGTVFVIRSGVTPSALVRQGLDRIDEEKLRGVVLNGQTSSIPGWLRRLIGL
jgi:capsular exopolysaccharide synthesis family protein